MRLRPILATAVVLAAAAVPMAAPANAAPAAVIDGLAGPLSFSVDHGTVIVAQSFGGKLTRVHTDGTGRRDLYTRSPKFEIGAVESAGPGTLFAISGRNKAGKKFSKLVHRTVSGKVTTRANLRTFEKQHNPDHSTSYGFRDLSNSCAAKVPAEIGGKPYRGIVDSHPYGTALLSDGSAVVADAAGNDLLRVTKSGQVSVIAVLPAQPLKVTTARAAGMHLPKCTVGHKYYFEAVPTDVERRHGQLYVTTLPGGPEDSSLGARGKVYTVDPNTGAVTRLARGFLGATGVAVSTTGHVYVAELFANRISTIVKGKRATVASLSQPSALEWHGHTLFATKDTLTSGSIVKVVL